MEESAPGCDDAHGHMPPELKSARLATGLTLPYVEQGNRPGTPVVFLHAFADSWRSFELVLPHVPRSIHAFAVTQRGHAEADRPPSGYGLAEFTADVEAFMDAVELGAAVIVGSSSGGYVAQRFAIDHPERTLGLVLIGTPRSLRDKPSASEFARAVSGLRDPIDPEFVREFVESTVSGPVPAAFLEEMIGESLKVPARVWKATVQGLLSAAPPTETGTITVPTLILWGDRDGFLPRDDQEALAAAISGSQLVVYEGAGHVVLWEEPERVAVDVAALAARAAG
jgi:pimeloyl-ACP methyl ester carboxylesterase